MNPAIPPARAVQPLDSFMARVDQMLQHVPLDQVTALPPHNADMDQAAAIAAALLGSAEGLSLLEYICDHTVRRPQALPPNVPAEMGWAYAQRRAGQDDTLFFLLKLIALGRKEVPLERPGSDL